MIKDNIPLRIKETVWFRDAHPSDLRIAQCKTCYCLVKFPQSLNSKFDDPYSILPYECNGVGEFGHIVAEANGGTVHSSNLFVQCKSCNTRLGVKIIIFDQIFIDQYMIPVELLEENNNQQCMLLETDKCKQILVNGNYCKNKPVINRAYCHIHLNN